jgi:sugar transferase (PEP-CTERM system associated)
MIRILNTHFPVRTILLGFSDACLVTLAFLLATIARLGMTDAGVMLTYEQGILKIAVISSVFMASMYFFDLYESSILNNPREVLTRIIQALGAVCIILAVLYYIYPPVELGRGIFVIGIILMALLLFFWRRLFLALNVLPRFAERTLILGDGTLSELLRREFSSRPELGVQLVGPALKASASGNDVTFERNAFSERSLAAEYSDDLAFSVKSMQVNRIVVAMGDRRGKLPVDLLLSLKSRGMVVQDGTDVYEAVTGKVPIESLRLGWLLFSPGFRVSRFLLLYKRFASIAISILGLILSLPLLLLVVTFIKLTSRGTVFYRQKRVGRNGVSFYCYKVRTMRPDAEADSGPTWAGDDDPRITRVGRFLRKSRIDEIPQLWNVLKGDMHLIGPRPERPEFVEWLEQEIPHYQLRHNVRPGITGWAQIRYRYGSSVEDAKEKLRYDLFYVKNMSPGLDILILFQTIKIILLGRGAK